MQAVNYVGSTVSEIFRIPVRVWNAGKDVVKSGVGVAGSVVSVATAGMFKGINDFADYTRRAPNVLPVLYTAVARVINPAFSSNEAGLKVGLISEKIALPILAKAANAAESENSTVRHVAARALYLVGTVASVAAHVADLAIGVLAAGISIVPCFARVQAVNTLAVRQLSSLGGIVQDVCLGARGFVNPQQFVSAKEI